MLKPPTAVGVRDSGIHGRGVFALRDIAPGEVIERAPVLRLPASQRDLLDATLLMEYYFEWDGDAGVAFGYGGLYNHSNEPNAAYTKLIDEAVVEVRALSAIAVGDEVTFNYSGQSAAPQN